MANIKHVVGVLDALHNGGRFVVTTIEGDPPHLVTEPTEYDGVPFGQGLWPGEKTGLAGWAFFGPRPKFFYQITTEKPPDPKECVEFAKAHKLCLFPILWPDCLFIVYTTNMIEAAYWWECQASASQGASFVGGRN